MFGNVTTFAFTVRRSAAAFPMVVLPLTVRLPLADKDDPLTEELDAIEPVTVRLFDMTVTPVTLRVLLIVNGLENDTFAKNDTFPLQVKVELSVVLDETVRLPAIEFDDAELVWVMLPNTDRLPALVEMFPVAASDERLVTPLTVSVEASPVAPVTFRVPTMFAAVVESWSAESVPPPSLTLLRVPLRLALSEVLSRPV